MTIGGWIFLTISLAFVWGLCTWCFSRVLRNEKTRFEPPPDSLGG